ncbi:MAG: glycoside hydrolase family 16 protein, partial [Solirubrobacterales bacterium]
PKGMAAPVTYNNMESTPYAANRNTVSGGQLHQTVSGGRTGTVNTLRSYNFTYGYVEARIKVPSCSGCWPAFWMLGSTPAPAAQAWPPEIDIFEFFPNIPGGHPLFNSHWRNSSGAVVSLDSISPNGQRGPTTDMANYTGAFHTYGFAWTRDYVQGYIDGVPGQRYSGPMVPHQAMYLILTLQSAKGYTTPDGSAMHTDYVRVYKQ